MSYTASPVSGHTAEEIHQMLKRRNGIQWVEIDGGIVYVDTKGDPPSQVSEIAFIEYYENCGRESRET